MPSTLTCWKEIAEYLHKGVRTVQRYEQQMGLPVHRRPGQEKGVVLAFSYEVEIWMRSHFGDEGKSELEILRKELAEVKEENKLLRARLEPAERVATLVPWNGKIDLEQCMDELWQKRGFQAVEKSKALRLQSAGLIDASRIMQELLRQREKDVKSLQPSLTCA